MERVFHEMGIGSPRNLHEFYQNRIVRYHEHLLQVYQRLQDDYSRILNQINNGSELVITAKVTLLCSLLYLLVIIYV